MPNPLAISKMGAITIDPPPQTLGALMSSEPQSSDQKRQIKIAKLERKLTSIKAMGICAPGAKEGRLDSLKKRY